MKRTGVNEATYEIWSRDWDFTRIDMVEDWQSLSIDLKWGDMSTWTLTLPTAEFMKRWHLDQSPRTTLLAATHTPTVPELSILGILIFRNEHTTVDQAILSGVITEIERDWDGYTDTVTLTGEADTYYLRTRLATPDSRHWWNNTYFWWWSSSDSIGDTSYTWHGALETMLKGMVVGYCVTPGVSFNVVPWLYVDVNEGRGPSVTYDAQFQNLYSACQDMLGSAPGQAYTFDIKQWHETGDSRIIFRFLEANDNSDKVVFDTGMGNIQSYQYYERLPEFNYALTGGCNWQWSPTQESTTHPNQRIYQDNHDYVSQGTYGMLHGFVSYSGMVGSDKTVTNAFNAMNAEAKNQLYLAAKNQHVTITLLPEYMNDFNVNWFLGDKVTVAMGYEASMTEYIREITIDVSPDGEVITPTLADPQKFMRMGGITNQISRQNQSELVRRGNRGGV